MAAKERWKSGTAELAGELAAEWCPSDLFILCWQCNFCTKNWTSELWIRSRLLQRLFSCCYRVNNSLEKKKKFFFPFQICRICEKIKTPEYFLSAILQCLLLYVFGLLEVQYPYKPDIREDKFLGYMLQWMERIYGVWPNFLSSPTCDREWLFS